MIGEEARNYAQGKVWDSLGFEMRGAQRWATARLLNTGAALALSGAATIDGVATANGNIVIETSQTDKTLNGPWTVAAGAWTRPAIAVGNGLLWVISAGTSYAGTIWGTLTAHYDKFVLGTSPIALSQQVSTFTTTLSGDRGKQPRAIGVDTTGGALTLALPADVQYEGLAFWFFDAAPAGSFAANNLRINAPAGHTINNAGAILLNSFKSAILRLAGLSGASWAVWGV